MAEPTLKYEIAAELRQLFSGRINVADGILPPLVFVVVNAFLGLAPAAVFGLAVAVAIVVWRLLRGRALRFAVAGLGGTIFAVLFALRADSASSYFLPGMISGSLTTALIVTSIFARRPFVAWTSWLMRGWPIEWYWHPRVRPAYTKASWLWVGFFGTRAVIQWSLYLSDETTALGVARVAMGWPALLALLIATYVLGRRWLEGLEGPSVAEFGARESEPWTGQRTGF